jgi:alpha-L-fucosidase
MKYILAVILAFASLSFAAEPPRCDQRMEWWRDAKFGMFIHWGLYAVPAGSWNGKQLQPPNGEWIMSDMRIPVAAYMPLAKSFNPVKFDAAAWVALAKAAGMRYIVITSKHHDGFALFKSAYPFNIVDATPYGKDPIADLAKACLDQDIPLGFYYSQDQDWTAPGGGAARGHWDKAQDGDFAKYFHEKALPQLKELLSNYPGAPRIIWFDTPSANMTPELANEVLALLKDHPDIIWNNRLGGGQPGDTETPEQHIPPTGYKNRDWETCMTINNTWGFRADDEHWKSTETLVRNLIDVVSKGGNYLLNIGPTAEGVVPLPEVDRLEEVGQWLKVNGVAIYGTKASPFKRQLAWGRATQKGDSLYLHVFDWPQDRRLRVPITSAIESAKLLAQPGTKLSVKSTAEGSEISLPEKAPDSIASVIELKHSQTLAIATPADNPEKLGAETAEIEGTQAQTESSDGISNIGYWTNPKDVVTWTANFPETGIYKATVNYACPGGAAGSTFEVKIGSEAVSGTVEPTGSWKDYKTANVGEIKVTSPGMQLVTVSPTSMPHGAVMNLRELNLTPVK